MTRAREHEKWSELSRLFSHVPLDDDVKAKLFGWMDAPDRLYHGTSHLALLWERHERYAAYVGFDSPRANTLAACAIAFHDCIYRASRRDNELRSAETWMRLSSGCELSDADRAWIADTIRATADHLSYIAVASDNPEQQWLEQLRLWVLDLDLTPFGETRAEFDRNTADLRAEYKHLTSEQWEENRLSLLQRFAAAPAIYRNAVLADAFEKRARENIGRQLVVAGVYST